MQSAKTQRRENIYRMKKTKYRKLTTYQQKCRKRVDVELMHQSIPPAPSKHPPPRFPGRPQGISTFFALDGNFPGVGTLELSISPGWGRKKRANTPSSVNTATFFIDHTVEQCHFKHFNVRFFV